MEGKVSLSDGLSMDCIGVFESMSIDIVYIPPKNEKPLVFHNECDEFLYVIEGELEIYIGDEIRTCRMGEYVSVPRGMKHGSINKTNQMVKLMAICAPPYKIEYEHNVKEQKEQL